MTSREVKSFVPESPDAAPRTGGPLADALNGLRYQQALEAGRIGTWWLDIKTGNGKWDAIAADIVGTQDATTSMDLRKTPIHHRDLPLIARSLETCAATGSAHDIEFRTFLPSGEMRWVRAIARPSATSGFGARWLTGVLFDVTDRRRAEDALRESQRQLATLL